MSFAFWGDADPAARLSALGMPTGSPGVCRLAIPVDESITATDVEAQLLDRTGLVDDPLFARQHSRSDWPAQKQRLAEVLIGRTREPVLTAVDADREGYVPNVIYTCGALRMGLKLLIPYGISDSAIGFASADIDQLVALMVQA